MIITQKWIKRSDLQANPDVKYLFGDNLVRMGLGGQAKEMRGEPNAIGIATKKTPAMEQNSFFDDGEYERNCMVLLEDFAPAVRHIMNGGTLVIPEDGLGTGLSQMAKRCPRTDKALKDLIDYLYNLDERVNS